MADDPYLASTDLRAAAKRVLDETHRPENAMTFALRAERDNLWRAKARLSALDVTSDFFEDAMHELRRAIVATQDAAKPRHRKPDHLQPSVTSSLASRLRGALGG